MNSNHVASVINKAWDASRGKTESNKAEQDSAAPAVSFAYERMDSIIAGLHSELDFAESRLASICTPPGPSMAQEAEGHYADGVQMAQMIHNQADRLYAALERLQSLNRRIAL